ncbi:8204_t:CDS:2, partial [Scutellospora calospora]
MYIFRYTPYSNEGRDVQTRTKKALGDFRHKLNQSVIELIKDFKNKREREGVTTSLLTNEDIKNFIDKNVVNNLLKCYISGTNQSELRKCGSLAKLVTFIHEIF